MSVEELTTIDRAPLRYQRLLGKGGSLRALHPVWRASVSSVVLVVLIVGWSWFGPVQLGGPASYVVTDGTSMLPHFKSDGLVITQERAEYHVGEVVAYHNKDLHSVVMHRIVARDGNRFIFQGDNNHFRDHYHPTKADLVGKEWIYWPNVGEYLKVLRRPVTFATVLGLLGFFALTGFKPNRIRRRRRHRHG